MYVLYTTHDTELFAQDPDVRFGKTYSHRDQR